MMFFVLSALAAEVTWMPDRLTGAASVRYDGLFESGSLTEGDTVISKRRVLEHQLTLEAVFSPVRGAALYFAADLTPSWSWSYPDARAMHLEPVNGGGSYLLPTQDVPTEDASVEGGGLNGFWVGARLSPFSERYAQNHKITYLLDVAFRTGNSKNRWTITDGKRGASPGGTAFRLGGAFSSRIGRGQPYVRTTWVREGAVTVDLLHTDGSIAAADVEIQPASRVELQGGTEIIASERGDALTSVDLFLGGRYRSWSDVPSGLYLPHVLDASHAVPVTRSENVQTFVGMGINMGFSRNIRLRIGGQFEYIVPYTQEHLYSVQTSTDSFGIRWNAALIGVIGKRDFEKRPEN